MKKNILLLCVLLSFTPLLSHAQNVEKFENWTTYNVLFTPLTKPAGWSATDSFVVAYGKLTNPLGTYVKQIYKATPGHSGSSAMKVTTQYQDSLIVFPNGNYPGLATNATITLDLINQGFSLTGGLPMNGRPLNTTMYVKNKVVGGDSTYIQAFLLDDGDGADSLIAFADTVLGTNITAYTQLTLPFKYNGSTLTPTYLRYIITSGNLNAVLGGGGGATVGTEIVVDDINVSFAAGLQQTVYSSKQVALVYPSILDNDLHVVLNENESKTNYAELSAINGQLISTFPLTETNTVYSVSPLATGTYVLIIKDRNGNALQTTKLVK